MNDQATPLIRVSVVLTVLNEGESIGDICEAMLRQTRPPDEIVIVDGGSADDTVQIIREIQAGPVPIVLIERPGANIAEGRNIAIEAASGDVIAVTDGGCLPHSAWLERLLEPIERDHSIDAVSGSLVVDARTDFEVCSGLLSTPSLGERAGPQKGMFYGRNSCFSKRLWREVGGYPEWLYTAEDSLFALAANAKHFKVEFAPAAEIKWRPRSTLRSTAKMFYLYGRGNGRIGWGSAWGAFYWVRYYLVAFAALLSAVVVDPIFFVLSMASVGFLAWHLIQANRHIFRKAQLNKRYWPILLKIIFARNFFTNLGYIVGHLELRLDPLFSMRLYDYLQEFPISSLEAVSMLQRHRRQKL